MSTRDREELGVKCPVKCERKPFLDFDGFRVEEKQTERLRHSQQREHLGRQPNVGEVLDQLLLCFTPDQQQQSFAKKMKILTFLNLKIYRDPSVRRLKTFFCHLYCVLY